MRRGRLIRKVCARCGEVEFDEHRSTGQSLELEECADGKWRCPDCAATWDSEHLCYICEVPCENVERIEGELVCEICADLIKSGDQDGPAEIKAEQSPRCKGDYATDF